MSEMSPHLSTRPNASVAQLQLIADLVPALLAYVDAYGRYMWVNRAYEEWYELEAEKIVGKPALEVLTDRLGAEYAEQLRPKFHEALEGKAVFFEAVHYYGGTPSYLSLNYTPDFADNGEVRGFVLLVTNITKQRSAEEVLRASEERSRALAEALPAIVWTATDEGLLDYVSERLTSLTGFCGEDVLGAGWRALVHVDDLLETDRLWAESLRSGVPLDSRYRLARTQGDYRWFLVRAHPQRNDQGAIVRWVGASIDIHDQVLTEDALAAREKSYRLLFDNNPHPMWTFDPETLAFTSVNASAVALYGYTQKEFLSLTLLDILLPEEIPHFLNTLRVPTNVGVLDAVRHERKDGSTFWVEITAKRIASGDSANVLVLAIDVTERTRLDAELRRLAHHDSLTGLCNRPRFMQRAEAALSGARADGKALAMLAIDFDRFKNINDTFGHRIGDEFLKEACRRLESALKPSHLLARVGGDELLALIEGDMQQDKIVQLCEHLLELQREPLVVAGLHLQTTISMGISRFPGDGETVEDLRRSADQALYEAKRAGQNQVQYGATPRASHIYDPLEIEMSLRRALSEGGLEVHYQPLCARDGRVVKLEALVRLRHPHLGLLSPNAFISVAEESGLILSLDRWVFKKVCEQIMRWKLDSNLIVPVSVNVSAMQFASGDLARDLSAIIAQTGVKPDLLELELTESLLMRDIAASALQLQLLKRNGISIAVDDFGTGYSSLTYLQELPIDTLKIDRSFIAKLDSPKTPLILQAIVQLGKALDMVVVAEGVETPIQRETALAIGCDLLQGYLFGKPANALMTHALLHNARSAAR